MGYGKAWKLTTTQLEALIDAADSEGYCHVEVYNGSADSITDSELWLKYSTGWADQVPIIPPINPMPPTS